MEQAKKTKYDETTETRTRIDDPLGVSSESDQNQEPASQLNRKIITDTKEISHEDTPKVVELIPKSMSGAAPDVRRRRGILTEQQQLEGELCTSPSKESHNDDKSPKTLQEKKERYLKKANETQSFVSRSYMKKEFEHTSLTEVLDKRRQLGLLTQTKSNKTTETSSTLSDNNERPDDSTQNDGSGTAETLPSKVEEAASNPEHNEASSEPHTKPLTPYIETHFSSEEPNEINETESTALIEDSKQNGKDALPTQEEQTNSLLSQVDSCESQKIETETQMSSSEQKVEENIGEKDGDRVIESMEESSQIYSCPSQEKTDIERKSPDSSSGIDTDASERDEKNDRSSMSNLLQPENKMDLKHKEKPDPAHENNNKAKQERLGQPTDEQLQKVLRLRNYVREFTNESTFAKEAEPLCVVPNFKSRLPYIIPSVEPELPEKLKAQYELLGVSYPILPTARSSTSTTTVPITYEQFEFDRDLNEVKPHSTSAQSDADTEDKNLAPPEYSEAIPDFSDSDEVPDVDDEPMDLEILPQRQRRKGIVYPGQPTGPPQIPVPLPESESNPEQNQNPEPEAESPPDAQPVEPQPSPEPQPSSEPQPSAEPQGDQPNSMTEEPRNEEENASSQPNQLGVEAMELEEDTSSSVQDITEPEIISKHARQSQLGEINMVVPEIDSAPVPVTPDMRNEPPKPQNPSEENQVKPKPLADGEQETTVNDVDITETPFVIDQPSQLPVLPEPEGSIPIITGDEIIRPTLDSDTCRVPDVSDEQSETMIPSPTPLDPQKASAQELQEKSSESLQVPENVSPENSNKESNRSNEYADELANLNIENSRQVPVRRRRSVSLNEPEKSPKYKPIIRPEAKDEYSNKPTKKKVTTVDLEKKGTCKNDDMDIEMPFESKSDEATMSAVEIPTAVLPASEITIEKIPSSSEMQEECCPRIPNQTASQQKLEIESINENQSELAPALGNKNIAGVISCTLPSGPEENVRRSSSESNQQDAADSTTQKSKAVSNTAASNVVTTSGHNQGGSGSDEDDEDKNTQRRSNAKPEVPLDGDSESDEEEHGDEQNGDEEHQASESESRATSTRSKSDDEEKISGGNKLSSDETTTSESSGEEYLQPIQVEPEELEESIIVVEEPEDQCSETEDSSTIETLSSTSGKRKEPPSDESEDGPNKLLAREDGSGRSMPQLDEGEGGSAPIVRPARITHRRQPVPSESDISDLDRGLSESGISDVDGSSDRDATAGEDVSETPEDYTARRRLTRNQAAQIEAQQQRAAASLVSSGFDREQSSPSPEPEPSSTSPGKPSVIFSSSTAYDSSDSGSTLIPNDSTSSHKSSDKTLSSNSNEQATVPLRIPTLEELDLPQDSNYEADGMYTYREHPTSNPLVEVLILEHLPHSDKRKRASPLEAAEIKKIKTDEQKNQPGPSTQVDEGDVNMREVPPEEPVSDSDREVAAIMAVPMKKEDTEEDKKRKAMNTTRKVKTILPVDNNGRLRFLIFPPETRETSFVPYVPPNKIGETSSNIDSLNSSVADDKNTAKEEKTEQGTSKEKESTQVPKEEKTKPTPPVIGETLEFTGRRSFGPCRRVGLRNRESLEPQRCNIKENIISSPRGVETRSSARTNPPRPGRVTGPPYKPHEPANKRLSGGSCKEPTNKNTKRDDKDEPDSSTGRNSNKKQAKSPVKRPPFRR